MNTGRNFDEVLRLLDSCAKLTANAPCWRPASELEARSRGRHHPQPAVSSQPPILNVDQVVKRYGGLTVLYGSASPSIAVKSCV